jgi:HEAT repeat protein
MLRTGLIVVGAYLGAAIFAPPPFHGSLFRGRHAQGSDLARRVNGAPDGLVKMTYASRDNICGDGRSFIADASSGARGYDVWFSEGMFSTTSSMSDRGSRCTRGPVRLLLVVRDHRVVDVQPFVGPSSAATERAGTELGTVAVNDVARYLLDLAAGGRDDIARSAILAASIADSVRIAGRLADMARTKSLGSSVRESALKWVGRIAAREGDRDAMRVARTIAEDRQDQLDIRERAIRVIGEYEGDVAYLRSLYPRLEEPTLRERVVRVVGESGTKADMDWIRTIALDKNERTSIRERAVRVLGEGSDSRSLRELYDKLDDPSLRERVIRTLADIGDSESRKWLREIVERRTEPTSARERAIRSLAEQGDVAYLRSVYPKLDDESLRERIIKSVAESGGSETTAWLRSIVRDPKESSSLRERAVRSLAESGVPTTELISLYDSVTDRSVRDRLVSILAERGDRAARDKLRSIATDDPDEDLRRRATRKLAESK